MHRIVRDVHRLLRDPIVQRLIIALALALIGRGGTDPDAFIDALRSELVKS